MSKVNKWPLGGKDKELQGEQTSGRKKSAINAHKSDLIASLQDLRLPEIIVPKFSLPSSERTGGMLLQVCNGSVGYLPDQPVLSQIRLSLHGNERIALVGDNGSGKSTLVRALLGDTAVWKQGDWHVPKSDDVGYLDQHYETLSSDKSVLETICDVVSWPHAEIRRHLNDFLFRKNEEVNALVSTLSGGEKARLSLAQIAAKTPRLLILDEITNNLDLETRDHVAQVLKEYPGGIVVISHDSDFLQEIGVNEVVDVAKFK